MTFDTTEHETIADGQSSFGRRGRAVPPRDGQPGRTDAEDVGEDGSEHDEAVAAPRRRRSRGARRPSIIFLNFCITLAILGAGFGYVAYRTMFNGPGPLTEDATFVVESGATLGSVARDLQNRGMISNADLFKIAGTAQGADTGIQSGEFAIPAGASMATILRELVDGSPVQFRVTIPEGLTVYQAAQRIDAHPELTGELPATLPPEGWLAAQTVQFPRGTDKSWVIERLREMQEERVAAAFAARSPDSPVSTPEELLTLASIVEKETALAEERPLVAGVFANRVRENWHLNTDPTLIYGVFGGRGLPDGRPILQSDKTDRNPYNTYIFRGLPPGPIAIPGEATLNAVANPADTDAMFFVADGTGGHAFSATMAEHNEHVAALRRRERERREAAPATEIVEQVAEESEQVEAQPTAAVASAETADVESAGVEAIDANARLAAPAPPGFVKDGIPAPGIPVPQMRPEGF